MDVSSFIAVLLAGLLTGSELTSWGIVHPTLWKLDYRAQVRVEKLIYKRFATIDPFLMTATVVGCFAAAGALSGSSATLALAAGTCFAAMLAITLIGNSPSTCGSFGGTKNMGIRPTGTAFADAGTASTPSGSCSTAPASSSSRSPASASKKPGPHSPRPASPALPREGLEPVRRVGTGVGVLAGDQAVAERETSMPSHSMARPSASVAVAVHSLTTKGSPT